MRPLADSTQVPLPAVAQDGHDVVPRAEFRRYVAREMAASWLCFLALDRALRADLVANESPPPSRQLVARIRGWVRAEDFLREWQPAPVGAYRSGKAELDLSWCLARVWALRGQGSLESKEELELLFRAEVAEREPRLMASVEGPLAVCGDHGVGVEEVYPDLLALLGPAERDCLLLAALAR